MHGSLFGYKVLSVQACTVILQATTRLPLLGAVVWVHDSKFAESCFWVYVGALCFNCIYPSFLLHSTRTIVQRDGVLYCDTVCDLIYLLCFVIACTFLGFGGLNYPRDPFLFLSGFTPVLHIHTVLKAIEKADAERAGRRAEYELEQKDKLRREAKEKARAAKAQEDGDGAAAKTNAATTIHRSQTLRNERQQKEYTQSHAMLVDGVVEPMPRWATLAFTLTTLAVVVAVVLLQCRDRFPILAHNPCRPCVCVDLDAEGEGDVAAGGGSGAPLTRRELNDCPLVREISSMQALELSNMGITEIRRCVRVGVCVLGAGRYPKVYDRLSMHTRAQMRPHATHSPTATTSGAFNRLYSVKSLRSQNNSIAMLQSGAMSGLSNTRGEHARFISC